MFGFWRTVSALAQNFFPCLPAIAGREAFAVLEKPGGFRQGGLGKTAKVSGYQLVPRGGPRVYPLGGGEGHRERHFAQRNCLFSLQHSLRQSCPASRLSDWKPVSQTQGRWVSKLCVNRLSVAD